MKYVVLESLDEDGIPSTWLDPVPYLEKLPQLAEELPPGARDFALQPAHYTFGDPECIKSLRAVEVAFRDEDRRSATIRLSPNPWMHTKSLVIEYTGIFALNVEVDEEAEDEEFPWGLGRVLLDEILPTRRGCSHEIEFTGGRIKISCEDLVAQWE